MSSKEIDLNHNWIVCVNSEAITPGRIDAIQRCHIILALHKVSPTDVVEVNYPALPIELRDLVPEAHHHHWPLVFHQAHFVGCTAEALNKYLAELQSPAEELDAEVVSLIKAHGESLREQLTRELEVAESSGDLETAEALRRTIQDRTLLSADPLAVSAAEIPAPVEPTPAPAITAAPHTFPLLSWWFSSFKKSAQGPPPGSGQDFHVLRTGMNWNQQSRTIRVGADRIQRVHPNGGVLAEHLYEAISQLVLTDRTNLQVRFKSHFSRPEIFSGSNALPLALFIQSQAQASGFDIPLHGLPEPS